VTLRNGVLIYVPNPANDGADAMISITKPRMLVSLGGDVQSPGIEITGDPNVLHRLLALSTSPTLTSTS
jgi:alkyl sulfatase BDS1-like metallo-beta-lactamase superfamily hydrolase